MPDAHGNFKPFALSRKAAATYDRIFPKKCVREGHCSPADHVLGIAGERFAPGDRVRVIAEGLVGHVGTVLPYPGPYVWVRIDDVHKGNTCAAWRPDSLEAI